MQFHEYNNTQPAILLHLGWMTITFAISSLWELGKGTMEITEV